MNQIIIGNKIATARKQKGFSQAKLAELLYVTHQTVSKWERGESLPDINMLAKLAAIFNVNLDYFEETETITEKDNAPVNKKAFHKFNMSRSNWENADFSGIGNVDNKFNFSNISHCNFDHANLSNTQFKGNNIEFSNFSFADMKGSDFTYTNLENNEFCKANFSGAIFRSSNIDNNNFENADFTNTSFKSCNIDDNNHFDHAIFCNTLFKHTNLCKVTLAGEFKNCSFEGCDLRKTTFQNVTFSNCFFKNTKLKKTMFVNCQADALTISFLKACNADISKIQLIH